MLSRTDKNSRIRTKVRLNVVKGTLNVMSIGLHIRRFTFKQTAELSSKALKIVYLEYSLETYQ